MLKLLLFTTFLCSILSLQICRQGTRFFGHKAHDWILFDGPISKSDYSNLVDAAKKYESKEFSDLFYDVNTEVYIQVSLDGTTTKATVKEVNFDRGVIKTPKGLVGVLRGDRKPIGYKVVNDILIEQFRSALDSLETRNDSSIEIPKAKPVLGHSTSMPGGLKYVKPKSESPNSYMTDVQAEKVWSHPMYPKCLHFASQNTVGFHQINDDGRKGLKNDDSLSVDKGCTDPLYLPVKDGASRVASLLVCLEFMKRDIEYENSPRVKFQRAKAKKSTTWYSWANCPHVLESIESEKGLKSSYEFIMEKIPKKALCWDFVLAVRNMLCLADHVSDRSTSDDLVDEYFVNYIGDFRRTGSPKPFLVPQRLVEVEKGCRLVSLGTYVFLTGKYKLKSHEDDEPAIEIGEIREIGEIEDEVVEKGEIDVEEGHADQVMEAVKIIPPAVDPVKIVYKPTVDLTKYQVGEIPRFGETKTQKFIDDHFEKFPFAIAGKEAIAVSKEIKDYSSESSKSSDYSVTASTFASYLELEASTDYSHESLLAAAKYLDVGLKKHLKINDGGQPLRILAEKIEAVKFGIETGLYRTAIAHGVCLSSMTREDCLCNVIQPLVKIVSDFYNPKLADPLEGENRAITIMVQVSGDYSVSVLSGSYGAGLYVTFEWMRNDIPTWRVEMGGILSKQGSFALLSTSIVATSVTASLQIGLFFGRNDQISDYAKNGAVGVSEVAKFSFGLTLMFRKEYKTKLNTIVCAVTESAIKRNLAWPVSPKCIRGFAISVSFGLTAGVETPVSLSVATSFSKTIASRAYEKGGEKEGGWTRLPKQEELEQLESELEEISNSHVSSLLF